ncbi:putative cation-transporting ATPase W08D2.5 [Trichinella pseudospiralis]|uniref:Cation-transporting ATPase n=1 Tax=Trichinella pseudospiralis TaxID=6337 RepID=A0A0V0XZS5_TRIPS|nr:putative cation-transporting ATPase W08D2.5 [Trichinella pseudospiralis]
MQKISMLLFLMGLSSADGGTSVEVDERTRITIWGYCECRWKRFLLRLASFLTLGFFRLLLHWKPSLYVKAALTRCSLKRADVSFQWSRRPVRVISRPENFCLLRQGGTLREHCTLRYFTYRKLKFVWFAELGSFHRLQSFDGSVDCDTLHTWRGWTDKQASKLIAAYGANEIAIRLKSVLELVFTEVLNPFYVFQLFSVTIWFSDTYYYYASIVLLMSACSVALDVYQIKKNQTALQRTVHKADVINVLRDQQLQSISTMQLVPGDVILIPAEGCVMMCDAVLIFGNCIVNESSLTGESVPVMKTAIPAGNVTQVNYDHNIHAKHTLYCGTHVLQTRYYSGHEVKAVVTRTGFSTQKGQLVRSIMYPKPVDFEFTKDLLRFVGVLALIASVGIIYTIVLMTIRGANIGKIFVRALDLITICVPPALPAAMTMGVIAAESRLKKKHIYCISPNTVNTCGGINVVCFDKTGTLTEDGLDFLGILPTAQQGYVEQQQARLTTEQRINNQLLHVRGICKVELKQARDFDADHSVVRAMACCHSLTQMGQQLAGDPLDVVMFNETGWRFEESQAVSENERFDILPPTLVRHPNSTNVEIAVLKQYPFSSDLQRMSVLTRELLSNDVILYCKGAPETVVSLCRSSSIPENFDSVLGYYTQRGFRVLALAMRLMDTSLLKTMKMSRDAVEADLTLLALLIFENRLKPQTTPVIGQLRKAGIRTVMITGDNILTATCVARECSIVDESLPLYFVECNECTDNSGFQLHPDETTLLMQSTQQQQQREEDEHREFRLHINTSPRYQLAVSGKTFDVFCKRFPHLLPKLICVCNVFARMSPEQKTQLVNILQQLDYVVAMCGDGANDCGALKAAHAGISLSGGEASIASPFTYKLANIDCVVSVIREGRAALTTSFGVFKYMASYSLTQFLSVSLVYWLGSNLADFQFLFIDLVLITLFTVSFGRTPAADGLHPRAPNVCIMSSNSVSSLVLQLVTVIFYQVFSFVYVSKQAWFVPHYFSPKAEVHPSYQGTAVFLTSTFQYITLVVVYSKSFPYRKSMFRNRLFLFSVLFAIGVSTMLTLNPPAWIVDLLELKMPPDMRFRTLLLLLAVINFLHCLLIEECFVDRLLPRLRNRLCNKKHLTTANSSNNKHTEFQSILEEIGTTPTWIVGESNNSNNNNNNNNKHRRFSKLSSFYNNTSLKVDDQLNLYLCEESNYNSKL